jgi:hypothetical protein
MTSKLTGISYCTTLAALAVGGACQILNTSHLSKLKNIAFGIVAAGSLFTALSATLTISSSTYTLQPTAALESSILGSTLQPALSVPKEASWSKDPFLCRIKVSQGANITAAMQAQGALTCDNLWSLQKGMWDCPPFCNRSTEQIAALSMQAYLDGNLTIDQLSKINLYLTCKQKDKDVAIHHLVSPNTAMALQNRALLEQSFGDFFSPNDFNALFSELDPAENCEFFTLKYPLLTKAETNANFAQGLVDFFNLGNYILDFPMGIIPNEQDASYTVCVIPPQLWRKMLAVRFGNHAVEIKPVLGYRPIEKLSNFNERIIGVPSPFLPVQSTIHEKISVDGIGFYAHDLLYHSYVESANPHREFWTQVALSIRDNREIKDNIRIFQTLVDRDFPIYGNIRMLIQYHPYMHTPTISELFWYSLPFLETHSPELENWRKPIMNAILKLAKEGKLPEGVSLNTLSECARREPENSSCSLKSWEIANLQCQCR